MVNAVLSSTVDGPQGDVRCTSQPGVMWDVSAATELAPWLDIVAEANEISFFSWHVRDDRLEWSAGAEERMGLPAGKLRSFGQWYRFVVLDDARMLVQEAARLVGDRATSLRFRYRSRPSTPVRVMEAVGHCVYDAHGRLERVLGAVRDVTENVRAARDLRHLRHLRHQFLRRGRLDALGAVAVGLAHELNQPLSAAANYLGALKIDAAAADTGALLDHADRAAGQIERAGDIIRRLRSFLSGEDRLAEWLSVGMLVNDALLLALPGARGSVDLVLDIDAGLSIFADRVQIQQALVNVLHNAMGAMATLPRAERRITIGARRHAGQVEVSVSDAGPGFSAETLEALHRPFPSMAQPHGMGAGLAICRHIMEENGGHISFGSAPDGGARICFLFPIDPVEDDA